MIQPLDTPPSPRPRRRTALAVGLALLGLLLALLAALIWGAETIDLAAAWRDWESLPGRMLLQARLPRVLLAALVGGALGAAGTALQALLRNPLADPLILGVSGGAALGGTLVLAGSSLLGLGGSVPLGAFVGAIGATLLVYRIATVRGTTSSTTILLVGVVVNAFASAVIMFIKTMVAPENAQRILYWLMGSLGYPDWGSLGAISLYVAAGMLLLLLLTPAMNAMVLGDSAATHLGVPVERTKRVVFVAASLMVGAVVSVSGLIGFVGLMVPHIVRLMVGFDHRLLLPLSGIAGAALLVLCDLGARLLFRAVGTEPPVGAITALLGGPFFLVLLRRRGAR